jgi:hypothetical protein
MGKVSEYLVGLIAKQVEDKGIVVWYDPEKFYAGVVDKLAIPNTTVLRYADSFFALRALIEPFLEFIDERGRPRPECEVQPRLIIYIPKARSDAHYALVEAEHAGVVMEPGAHPWQRNTRLKVMAEQVFKRVAPDSVDEIRRQIDEGVLSLKDLDKLSEEAEGIATGTIKIIFGTTSAVDVALSLVSSSDYDEAILTKKALPEIAGLLSREMGIAIPPDADLPAARKKLIRTLLLSELVAGMSPENIPDALFSVDISKEARHIEKICRLCTLWRNRIDCQEAYVSAAKAVETDLGLSSLNWEADTLKELSTFPFIERANLRLAEEYILQSQPDQALELSEKLKNAFWAAQEPVFQLHWKLIENCAQIISMVQRISDEGKTAQSDKMVESYTQTASPWCLLDSAYRRLESQYCTYELDVLADNNRLELAIARVRQIYSNNIRQLNEMFTDVLANDDFHIRGFSQQSDVFKTQVKPLLQKKEKTAYMLVDALRFEMGKELVEGLQDDFAVTLEAGIAQLPTITAVGMAALMPGAEDGMELAAAQGGKMAVQIGSKAVKDRSSRMKLLEQAGENTFVACKLGEIIKPSKKLRDEILKADWIAVTSQELDRLGEDAEEEEVRLYMDEILEKLRRGIRRLALLGVNHIVVTADHGHLFGETIESGMKMDPPGGNTVELHRRVWIGIGGMEADGFMRVKASQLGLAGDLELAFPRSLACFKVKGGVAAYFHGGMSLQEMVIPIILLKKKEPKQYGAKIPIVKVVPGKTTITTRFFSVTATYVAEGLFGPDEIRVKFSVTSRGKEVGFAAMSAYGFEEGTKEIILHHEKPNAVTFMLTEGTDLKNVSVRVTEVLSQVEIARTEDIPVSIAI